MTDADRLADIEDYITSTSSPDVVEDITWLITKVRELEGEVSKHEHIEASEVAEWKQRCAELEQDKARLDWLDARRSVDLQCGYNPPFPSKDSTWYAQDFANDKTYDGDTIREAIDAAIAAANPYSNNQSER